MNQSAYIRNQSFDEERALYGQCGITVENCRFEGPADGESAIKECCEVTVRDCQFHLRYPLWHVTQLRAEHCEMSESCRAALWYCREAELLECALHGIKALRECSDVRVEGCSIRSEEFGWMSERVTMRDTEAQGAYFLLHARELTLEAVTLRGKYSFQYVENATFRHCVFDTKDALWHAKHVRLEDCTIRGEYLAWYSEDVTFVRCHIVGTQPLCYCRGLVMIDCTMEACDLSFERSEVEATLLAPVLSIKNPRSGVIRVPAVGEIVMDDPEARGQILSAEDVAGA